MKIIDSLKKLESHNEFKKWLSENKNSYLSYGFKMLNEPSQEEWQLGFYNKDTDKMTTFVLDGNKLNINEDEEVFKKPSMKVNEIKLEKIKISFEEALRIIEELFKKEYKNELQDKTIVILQNLEELGDVWNITHITKTFNTINFKVDTENGKIIEHSLTSIFDFRKDDDEK